MCIKVACIPNKTYICCPCRLRRRRSDKKMSFQKKNVIQEFMKDDYVPTAEQFVVKYCSGKGNNLHEVECVDGSILLVSMPKKYRHTIWLKKDDCLVIDPIEEGKKVKGEIVCVLHIDTVRDLISSHQWPRRTDTNSIPVDVEALLQFFTNGSERKSGNDDLGAFPPSDSEEDEDEEEDDEEEEESDTNDNDDSVQETKEDMEHDLDNSQSNDSNEDIDEDTRDRNRSRVQLVTSGVVTVTNVITEGLVGNDIQSLEFEADEEESSDELSHSRDLERHANTIRIQVNYNNANTCTGATGD